MNMQNVEICGVSLQASIYYQPKENPIGDYPGCEEEFTVEELKTQDGLDLVEFMNEVLGADRVGSKLHDQLAEYVKGKLREGMARDAA
jgi:hypothetical protein